MAEILDKNKIRDVFRDVKKHQQIGQVIRRFSTNKDDIRYIALGKTDLSNCRNVLDLGCAFGAFTEALKGKLHSQAKITGLDIIPEYEPFFLKACKRAGYSGTFSAVGVEQIIKYPTASFDLVICSYALYFFSHLIEEISRILSKSGIFITITHSEYDMQELVQITKKVLKQNKMFTDEQSLPIEKVVSSFSAQNGGDLLAKHFGRVQIIDFKNVLVFQPQEFEYFLEYFQFKKSFFLIESQTNKKDIVDQIMRELHNTAAKENSISMCKDDRIFIAFEPLSAKELA